MTAKKTNPASAAIRAMDGARIPGGCDRCDAYQTIHADHYGPDMHRILVHHDDWCPFLASLPEATP
jgi:hypothetical protein